MEDLSPDCSPFGSEAGDPSKEVLDKDARTKRNRQAAAERARKVKAEKKEAERSSGLGKEPKEDSLGATDLPESMGKVLRQTQGRDRGELERHCRKWLVRDVKGFMAKYTELLQDARQVEEKAAAPVAVMEDKPDETTEELLEFFEKQLREKPWLKG